MDNSHAPSVTKEASPTVELADALRQRDEKLEALKGLVDHLAHDFNNMLVPLLGYVTLIKEELAADSSPMKYAARIEHSARKTEALIEKILTAVRPQRCFNPTPGDLASVIEKVVRDWEAALPKNSQIKTEMSLQPCPLVFDHALVALLMDQLLSNARYAVACGGLLRICLRPAMTGLGSPTASPVRPDMYELIVSDNGLGMPPSVLRHVCEPFFTTRPRGQALGLGLTSVHSIAQLHGGQFAIESTEDVGTTITLFFPLEAESADASASLISSARRKVAHHRGPKVLVVDEDPVVREALKTCLQRIPADAAVFQDGAEALKTFQRNARQFRFVICEFAASGMNGLELCEQVRQISAEIPVAWICGDQNPPSRQLLSRFEPNPPLLLRKPFRLKELTETVQKHLT